jgi:hypothetical protein
MLNAMMLSVVMLSFVMLSVVAPLQNKLKRLSLASVLSLVEYFWK